MHIVFSDKIDFSIFILDILNSCEEILNAYGIIGSYIYWDSYFPFDYYLILKEYYTNKRIFNIDYDDKISYANYEKLKYELDIIGNTFLKKTKHKKILDINSNQPATMLFDFKLTKLGWAKLEFTIDNNIISYNVKNIGFILMQLLGSINSFFDNDPIERKYKGEKRKYGWEINEFRNKIDFSFYPSNDTNYVNLEITEMKYKKVFNGLIPIAKFVDDVIISCENILSTYGIIGFYKYVNTDYKHFPITQYLLLKNYIKKHSRKRPVSNIEYEMSILTDLYL